MAVVSEGRVRRIVDYLNDGEELGVEGDVSETPRSPAAAARLSLPRFIRWPRLSRLGGKGGCGKEKTVVVDEEEVVADKSDQVPESTSVVVERAVREERESASTSATTTRRPDLGMGLSLVFLLAKASSELNNMVRVRAEMEALLKQIKTTHQVVVRETSSGGGGNGLGDTPAEEPQPTNPESTTSSCVTDRNDHSASARLEEQQQAVSSGTKAASCDRSSSEGGDECCCRARVDGLEEDFHAELERLQVTYGSSEIPLFAAEGELDSESDDTNDYRDENDDESGEVVEDEDGIDDNDDDDDETEYNNGVSAVELERRLHELLHERNRERIEELEAALRRAEKKLAEKEMEVCLWKDTAKFALRRENESE